MINDISNINTLQNDSLDEITKVTSNSAPSALSQASGDVQTFNDLLQDYQFKSDSNAISQADNDSSVESLIKSKLKKELEKDKKEDDNNKISNINLVNPMLQFQYDSTKIDKTHKIDMDSLSESDIKSVKQLLENHNVSISNINPQNMQVNIAIPDGNNQVSYKSLDCSKTLFNLIEYSYKTQKPIRLDFSNDSSVILKIDREGKLSAEFLAGSKAMETLLKDNLQTLKNKLDSEGIAYKNITYRDNSKKEDKKGNKGD